MLILNLDIEGKTLLPRWLWLLLESQVWRCPLRSSLRIELLPSNLNMFSRRTEGGLGIGGLEKGGLKKGPKHKWVFIIYESLNTEEIDWMLMKGDYQWGVNRNDVNLNSEMREDDHLLRDIYPWSNQVIWKCGKENQELGLDKREKVLCCLWSIEEWLKERRRIFLNSILSYTYLILII